MCSFFFRSFLAIVHFDTDMNKIGSLLTTLMVNNSYRADHTVRIQVHALHQELVLKNSERFTN